MPNGALSSNQRTTSYSLSMPSFSQDVSSVTCVQRHNALYGCSKGTRAVNVIVTTVKIRAKISVPHSRYDPCLVLERVDI